MQFWFILKEIFPFKYLEIKCLQAMLLQLTSGYPRWPLRYTKNNRIIFSIWSIQPIYAKYEIPQTCPPWETLFRKFSMISYLITNDPKRPLSSTEINRNHPLNMRYLHPNYEIYWSLPSGEIVLTSIFHCFYSSTFGNPSWPLTSTKNYRDHLLKTGYPRVKYDIPYRNPA